DVLLEAYIKTLAIEARTLVSMLRQHVMPAAVRYQAELAETVSATQAAGLSCPDTLEQLQCVIAMISDLRSAIEEVETAEQHHVPGDVEKHAKHYQQKLVPAMDRARAVSDALEAVIPDDLWTLPSYAEMLF